MKWEFFSEEVTDKGYCLAEPGPLYSPVDRFTFSRDKSRRLYLETTSPISSTSQAAPPKTGEVYFNTTRAVFRAQDSGACKVTAHGVAKELTTRALAGDIKTTARFRVQSLEWERDDHSARKYTMEWVENMPRSVHWPHRNELVKKGETIRTLSSSQGAVKLVEHVDDSIFMEHCCESPRV